MFIINSNNTNYVINILNKDDGLVCHIFDLKNYYQEALSRFEVLERARVSLSIVIIKRIIVCTQL
jgi:hypothetical protein